jgi:predicted MFS family arabinose efflux permease
MPLVVWLAFPAPGPGRGPVASNGGRAGHADDAAASSATLLDALAHPCFWAFALSISLFGLVTAGVSLFQQMILAERGLPESVFHAVLVVGLLAGLAANFAGGWLSRRHSMASLLAAAMFLLAGSLATLPLLRTAWQAYAQAAVAGAAGGLLTVLFFAVWAPAFGSQHLGRIQGAAQMMTVVASAVGPVVVAWGRDRFGSYLPVLGALAAVSALLGAAALRTTVPSAARGAWAGGSVPNALPE